MPATALAPGNGSGGLKLRPSRHGSIALPTLAVIPPVLVGLSKLSRDLQGNDASGSDKAKLASLCHDSATTVQQYGKQLPAQELAFLGSSIWQSAIVLAGRGNTQQHQEVIAALVKATVDAALPCHAFSRHCPVVQPPVWPSQSVQGGGAYPWPARAAGPCPAQHSP